MAFVTIGTQYVQAFSICTCPSTENRCVLFPSRIVMAVFGLGLFPLSTSGRTLDEKACKCRQQFEFLSDFTLDLLDNDWVPIVSHNCASTAAMYVS